MSKPFSSKLSLKEILGDGECNESLSKGRMNSTSTLRADWLRKPPNQRVKLNCLETARKK